MKAILCLLALVALAYAAAPYTRILSNKQIAKMRCSLDSNDETFFFFNGTVIQYGANGNTVLFNTIGINVGRCFLVNNTYILSSRELLYYTNATTNEIINRWVNPEGQEVTVMHVDNDPVIQRFPASMVAPAMVLDGKVVLSLDIPLYYPNPLSNVANNSTFAAYSPQTMYQAGEFFKFISDNADIDDQSKDTVDYSIVSWTRTGPYLPWMKRGNAPGYLIYSSAGNRISSWEEMPAGVKQDLENRIPHYKHAPTCAPAPAVASVSSWSFFKAKFAEYLAGAQFPLSTPAVWACYPGTELPTPAPSTCKAKVDITAGSSWTAGGVTFYTSYLTFKNTGNSAITEIKVNLGGDLKESWNLEGSQSVREVNLWSDLAVGTSTSSSDYGVIARHAPVSVSIVSVQC